MDYLQIDTINVWLLYILILLALYCVVVLCFTIICISLLQYLVIQPSRLQVCSNKISCQRTVGVSHLPVTGLELIDEYTTESFDVWSVRRRTR